MTTVAKVMQSEATLGPGASTDVAEALAHFVAESRYEQLTAKVNDTTRRCILDTVGVTSAAGTRGLGHDQLVDLIARAGGTPESTIIGFGRKVPSWMAAFANGAMARAVNFDDGHDEGSTHPSSVVIPAALAVAERKGVDGRTFMTAVAVGNEVICRLGRALARRPGGVPHDRWFLTSTLGIFGATAACCRILGLDMEKTRHAFGIALFESSGTMEAFSPTGQPSMMRGMVTGLTAKSAVLVALMAEAGITGVPDSFEGRYGLFPVYFDSNYDRQAIVDDLGLVWAMTDIGLKAWPTMRYISSYVDAVGQIVSGDNIAADDIEEIRVHVAGHAATRCEPLAAQRRPSNYNHAGHALPYLVAAMAVRRSLSIDDLVERLDDVVVLSVAQRVVPVHDPLYGGDNRLGPAKVVVKTRDGVTHERALEFMYGDPRNPMEWADLIAKVRGCIAYRREPLDANQVSALIRTIESLEDLPEVAELARRLA